MDGWKPWWQTLIALTLSLSGVLLAVPLGPPAYAQTFPTGFVPSNEPAFGSVSPAMAFNIIGTNHTVTFTCTAAGMNSIVTLNQQGALVTTTNAGCYDVIGAVQDFSTGSAANIVDWKCRGTESGPVLITGSTVSCTGPLTPFTCPTVGAASPFTFNPTTGMCEASISAGTFFTTVASCTAVAGAVANAAGTLCMVRPATNNTMALTINPEFDHTFGIFFTGYVPATCPAGTLLEGTPGALGFGTCVTAAGAAAGTAPTCPTSVTGQTVTPVARFVGGPPAFCAFEVLALKKYADIRSITLTVTPSPCSGTFVFAQGLQAYFGPGCTVSASAIGTVVLKQAPCTVENLPQLIANGTVRVPPDLQPGTLICENGLVAVTNIPMTNVPVIFRVSGPGSFTTLTSVTGFCSGIAGSTSLTAGTGVAVTFCPTGPGTGSIQACLGGNLPSTKPPVCSNSIPFSYVGTATNQAGQGTSTVSSSPPPPGKFAKVCPKYPTKYAVCQPPAPSPAPRAQAPVSPLNVDVCPIGCRYSRIADAVAAAASGSTIRLGVGRFAGGVLIDKSVSLAGVGIGATVIAGGGPVITITPGATVQMSGVTITGGTPSTTEYTPSGSGVVNRGTLTLSDSSISGNTATYGGGLANLGTAARLTLVRSTVSGNTTIFQGGGMYNEGTLTLIGSTVSRSTTTGGNANVDHAGGGGIFNAGALTLTNSVVSGNTTISSGGGIANWTNGTVMLTNSTISDNSATFQGGGIYNLQGTVTLQNSTVSGNATLHFGGGLVNWGTMTLINSTVSGNRAVSGGGGIESGGTLTLTTSTIRGNLPDNCLVFGTFNGSC